MGKDLVGARVVAAVRCGDEADGRLKGRVAHERDGHEALGAAGAGSAVAVLNDDAEALVARRCACPRLITRHAMPWGIKKTRTIVKHGLGGEEAERVGGRRVGLVHLADGRGRSAGDLGVLADAEVVHPVAIVRVGDGEIAHGINGAARAGMSVKQSGTKREQIRHKRNAFHVKRGRKRTGKKSAKHPKERGWRTR